MTGNDLAIVHRLIEVPSWAPWLRFSLEDLAAYAAVFPEGQFIDPGADGQPVAALTTIRTTWSGDPDELGTWDSVSGHDSSVGAAHDPDGNTLVLLSMSVRPEGQGRGTSTRLVAMAVALARREGIEHVIGPFRPSGYGAHKAAGGPPGIQAWCETTRNDGLPRDPWLRALVRLGMRRLKLAPATMVVEEPIAVWQGYRESYRPELWSPRVAEPAATVLRQECGGPSAHRPGVEVWECGETGSWFVEWAEGIATYAEANLWGEVPLDGARRAS